jgi:hypothetical protein
MTRYNPKPALFVGVMVLILGLIQSFMEGSYAMMFGFVALGLYSWLLLQSGARIETNEIVALKSHVETRKDIHELRDKLDGVIHWKKSVEAEIFPPLEASVVPPVDPSSCDHDWKQSTVMVDGEWGPDDIYHCGKCGLDGQNCDACNGLGTRPSAAGPIVVCEVCGGDGVVAEPEANE